MKKGLIFTLLTVTFAIAQVSTSYATAPVIGQPGDVTIGDLEEGTTSANVFVYPDAFDLRGLFKEDDTESAETIRWSYFSAEGESTVVKGVPHVGDISINGADSLDGSGTGANDPSDPAAANRIDLTDDDSYDSDGLAFTVTFRDTTVSPDDGSTTYSEPAEDRVVRTVTLHAGDGSSSTSRSFLVVTQNDTSDSLSAGVEGELVLDANFGDDGELSWFSGVLAGTASAALDLAGMSGLCMQVGTTGQFWANWVSPEETLDMVGNAVWRARYNLTTDQTVDGAIPFWSASWDNFDSASGFISIGGEDFLIDTAGFAQGIGRPQGIDTAEVWIGPTSTTTPQWNDAIDDPANSDVIGLRLIVNTNDTNVLLGSDTDSGTICVSSLQVHRFDATEFETTMVWGPALDASTHDFELVPFSSTSALADSSITGGVATIDPTAVSAGGVDAMFLRPNDASVTPDTAGDLGLGNPLKFDPVIWEADTVYTTEVDMRTGGSGTDPLTIITMITTGQTFEHISLNFLSRAGVGGDLDRASSPNGTTATWRSYYSSHNVSLASAAELPNANRFHPLVQTFNSLFAGVGDDPLIIEGWRVSTVENISN